MVSRISKLWPNKNGELEKGRHDVSLRKWVIFVSTLFGCKGAWITVAYTVS